MIRRPITRLHGTLVALACACGCAGAAAQPAPGDTDVMTQLLLERGLLDPQAMRSPQTVGTPSHSVGLVSSAMNFLGVPYRRGGNTSDDGFDCSGFTRHVYESALGLLLPRQVEEQARATGLSAVKRNELQPGDLVFFNTLRRTFSHVGIYIGEGKFIHAPRTGGEVRVESMGVRYWARRYTGARRADGAGPQSPVSQGSPAAFAPAPTPAPTAIPNDVSP